MKQCPPIVLFIALLFFSCQDQNKKNQRETEANNIENHLKIASDFSQPDSVRLKNGDIAYSLAKKSANDSLLYKAVYVKIQNAPYGKEDSLDNYFQSLKNLSKNNLTRLAGYYQQKGVSFYKDNKDSSYYYHQEAKKLFSKQNDSLRAGYSLLILSELQTASADYNEVQSLATEALKYLRNSKRDDYVAYLNTMLGLSYVQLHDFDEAIKCFEEARKHSTSELAQVTIDNNIGDAYRRDKDYNTAIALFSRLIKNKALDADILSKARIIDNLGYTLYLNGDSQGIHYMLRSLQIKDSINDQYGKLASHLHLSEAYLHFNIGLAKTHAKTAFDIAEELKNDDDKLEALRFLSKTASSKAEAADYFNLYTQLNDELRIARQKSKNQFAKIKYDSSQADAEALQSKAESAQNKLIAERAKNRNVMAAFFILFLIAIGYLLYRLMRAKNLRETIKASYATEIRISKKVHDELANDLYNVMNLINNHQLENSEKKEMALVSLDLLYNKTRDISRENSEIELGEHYTSQLRAMLSDYKTEDLGIIITGLETIPWITINATKKTVVYRVLQELMVNMKKHSQATVTVIKFESLSKSVSLTYSDNGVGIAADKTFFKNGLQNVENRINGINGTFTFDKNINKGVKILMTFPL